MRCNLLFVVFLCFTFFSCYRERDHSNTPIEILTVGVENMADENIQITIEEFAQSQPISFILENIEGYYNVATQSGGLTEYIAFIAIEENDLVIYKFNIINGYNIYEEIIRFDLDTQADSRSLLLTNGDYRFTALIQHPRLSLHFVALIRQHERFEERLNFRLISKTIDEYLIKHTYDHQRQYVGIYQYYPLATYRTENEALIATIDPFWFSFLYDDMYEIIVNIDEDGFLFIEDDLGNAVYFDHTGDRHFRTKIIDSSQKAFLFHSVRVRDEVHRIYFLNGYIFRDVHISRFELGGFVEHIVARRKYRRIVDE